MMRGSHPLQPPFARVSRRSVSVSLVLFVCAPFSTVRRRTVRLCPSARSAFIEALPRRSRFEWATGERTQGKSDNAGFAPASHSIATVLQQGSPIWSVR